MAYPIHQHKCQMTRGGLSCWRAAYPEDTARAHCRCRRRQFYCSSPPMSWIWHKRNNMSDSFGRLDGFFLQFCSRNGWTFCHFSTLQYSSSVCVSHEHHRGGLRFLLWLIQYCPWRPFWYFPVLGLSESVNFHPDNCPYGRTITWATAKTFKAAAFSISSYLSFTIQLLL